RGLPVVCGRQVARLRVADPDRVLRGVAIGAGLEDAEGVIHGRRRQVVVHRVRRSRARGPDAGLEVAEEPGPVAHPLAPVAGAEVNRVHRAGGAVAVFFRRIPEVPATRGADTLAVRDLVDTLRPGAGRHARAGVVPVALVSVHVERVDLVTADHQQPPGRARFVVVLGRGPRVTALLAHDQIVALAGLVVQLRHGANGPHAERILGGRVGEAPGDDPDVLGRAARAGVRGRAPLPDLVEEPGVLAREHPNRAVRRDTR